MWWGEEISQPALPPAPDPSRSQRRTLGATRAHSHAHAHTSIRYPLAPPARPPSRACTPIPQCLGEGQARARPVKGCGVSVSRGHFSGHTGLLSEVTERLRPGSDPRVFKQRPRIECPQAGPLPCWALLCLHQAQGQVELGAHRRLYKSLIESLVHGAGRGDG